jgi:hypothetical protein
LIYRLRVKRMYNAAKNAPLGDRYDFYANR